MKTVKTAKLKITSHTKTFDDTIGIYRDALSFTLQVVHEEWQDIGSLSAKNRINAVENLIHHTKSRPVIKYPDFNIRFYKFPSYLRRSVISEAVGIVSSHMSRLEKWKQEKEKINEKNLIRKQEGKKLLSFKKKPPQLQLNPISFPVFYKPVMFNKINDGSARIKIYKNNDWVWIDIKYQTKNLLSSNNYRFTGYKEQNPKIVKKGSKYFLHIPYEKNVSLSKKEPDIVVGVDLGLNKTAVCSAVNSKGTVTARLFINQPVEKDRMKKTVNKLAKATRCSGINTQKPSYWRRINNLQKEIVQKTVDEIIDFAVKNNADVIVFEHLGKMKLPKGIYGAKRLRAKIQFWAKCKIQKKVELKAHNFGIRFSRILANGTSKYAFDGSGEVSRNGKKEIAKFATGKQYHADLSASYNIGARYFIRKILKPLPEMARSLFQAKVPELKDRTRHTLATLTSLIRCCEDCYSVA
ncbi:MAG: transposase [Desulforegulaceae bacterium]|nr:transposase [Desulforegulaceae bacterium]